MPILKGTLASHPNYQVYSHKLTEGWIPGRKIVRELCPTSRLISPFLFPSQDNSDAQYRTFRGNIGLLTLVAGVFFLLKLLYQLLQGQSAPPKSDRLHRIPFLIIFSILFLLGLHGSNALKILLVLFVNYLIAKGLGPSKLSPALTWLFNLSVLFAIDRFSGFPYGSLHPSLVSLVSFTQSHLLCRPTHL